MEVMSKVKSIEQAVEDLGQHELDDFRNWFAKFDAKQFDRKIERDAASGKLDHLIAEALEDYETGRVREL